MDEDSDACGRGEDDHAVEVVVEYEVVTDEEGDNQAKAAVIKSHIHGVPTELGASTLVLVAHKLLTDHMAHETFAGCPNHKLAHVLGSAAAKAYLINAIKTLPDDLDEVNIEVPDDISELLGE